MQHDNLKPTVYCGQIQTDHINNNIPTTPEVTTSSFDRGNTKVSMKQWFYKLLSLHVLMLT